MGKKKPVKLDVVHVFDNGFETWLYPHPRPVHIGVVDNVLYINGEAVWKSSKKPIKNTVVKKEKKGA